MSHRLLMVVVAVVSSVGFAGSVVNAIDLGLVTTALTPVTDFGDEWLGTTARGTRRDGVL